MVAIDGLEPDGTSYDVTFLHDNGHNRPVPEFATFSEARAASETLGGDLVQLEDEYLGSNPPSVLLIDGCPKGDEFLCYINTPDNTKQMFAAEITFDANIVASYSISVHNQQSPPCDNSCDYAIWTSVQTSVPEPPPLALLAVGMAGIAAARVVRRRKKCA